jgi:glycosyltransferase involved in cell wall biosynthesis
MDSGCFLFSFRVYFFKIFAIYLFAIHFLKILFLYTEIAAYLTSSVKYFLQKNPEAEVHIVRFPVNKEAPFVFDQTHNLFLYQRDEFTSMELIDFAKSLQPDIVLCSGWVDKSYLKICRYFHNTVPCILILDNHWSGNWKQWILRIFSRFTLHRMFTEVWVPGLPQKEYALKLGFKEKKIQIGFYCADTTLYSKYYHKLKQTQTLNSNFLVVARYIPAKGLENLWNAFAELKDKGELKEWELYCVGAGQDFETRKIHPAIHHVGFKQPHEIGEIIEKTNVFVLPSLFEPWGVVVHEYAAAGYPMLLSKNVGAASAFLIPNENGYIFDPLSKESIQEGLKKMILLNSEKINEMGQKSILLSETISPEKWAQTLNNFVLKSK